MEAKPSLLSAKKTLNVSGNIFDLTHPRVMGILNITPDSFYEGSRVNREETAIAKALQMLEEGASILDVGGYSSRPGADDISPQEETDRVLPVIELIVNQRPDAIISIDTFRASVAKEAIDAGAHIINDISGGQLDDQMFDLVSKLKVPYIMMHMKGTPQTMKGLAHYEDLVPEIVDFFAKRIKLLVQKGCSDIIIDPGFGFAKTIDHNFALLRHLESLKILGYPILVGVSRKSMIYKKLEISAAEALNGTTALHMAALLNGADLLRVHDVKEAVQTIELFKAIRG